MILVEIDIFDTRARQRVTHLDPGQIRDIVVQEQRDVVGAVAVQVCSDRAILRGEAGGIVHDVNTGRSAEILDRRAAGSQLVSDDHCIYFRAAADVVQGQYGHRVITTRGSFRLGLDVVQSKRADERAATKRGAVRRDHAELNHIAENGLQGRVTRTVAGEHQI